MIDRPTTMIHLLSMSHLHRDRLWIAAMARQTLTQVTSNLCRSMAELGYDMSLPNGYNPRFYSLSHASRRQSVSMTWALDPTRMGQHQNLSWRHFFGLIRGMGNGYGASLLCTRNGSASSISWSEDPSSNLADYYITEGPTVPPLDLRAAYDTNVFPKVMEVLCVFGSVCLAQVAMYGNEARAIPDLSPLLDQLIPLLSDEDKVILTNFLTHNSAVRLLCRSHIAIMEGRNVPRSTTEAAVGDADAQTAEATCAAQDVPGTPAADQG